MKSSERTVNIPIGKITLHGDLAVPSEPRGLVLFAHGSDRAAAARATDLSPACCKKPAWPRCSSIC